MTKKKTASKGKRTPTSPRTIPVVCCTSHRGVFFGHAPADHDFTQPNIRIELARNCVYWDKSIGGIGGLASVGPNASCKIGAMVPAVTLRDLTAVIECSEAAATAWANARSIA